MSKSTIAFLCNKNENWIVNHHYWLHKIRTQVLKTVIFMFWICTKFELENCWQKLWSILEFTLLTEINYT